MGVGFPTYPSIYDVEAYIRQRAKEEGIDENVAVEVAKSEGLQEGTWQSEYKKGGVREPSFGPFQLYDPPSGKGLGSEFRLETGLNPRNPAYWREQVDFALKKAKQGGWGPWYGAKRVGISKWQGLRGNELDPSIMNPPTQGPTDTESWQPALTGPVKINPARGPDNTGANMPQMPINTDPLAQEEQPQEQGGIMNYMKQQFGSGGSYWDVPFGMRLMLAGGALAGKDVDPTAISKMMEMARRRKGFQAMRQSLYAKYQNSGNPEMAEQVLNWSDEQLEAFSKGEMEETFAKRAEQRAEERDARKAEQDFGYTEKEIRLRDKLSPETQDRELWKQTIKDAKVANGMENASTLEVHTALSGIPDLQPHEVKSLANARTASEYEALKNTIIDNRTNASTADVAKDELELKKKQLDVDKAQSEQNAKDVYGQMMNSNMLMSSVRARNALKKQLSGEARTGAGITSFFQVVPGDNNSAELADALNSLVSAEGWNQIQQLRATGTTLGQIAIPEHYMAQAQRETLKTIRDPKVLDAAIARMQLGTWDMLRSDPKNPGKSRMMARIEKLIADPSPENMAGFNELYGDGMAEGVLQSLGGVGQ